MISASINIAKMFLDFKSQDKNIYCFYAEDLFINISNGDILFDITNYLSKYKPKSVMYSYYTEDTNDINNPDISKITIVFQKDIETFKKVMMDIVKKYNNKLNIYFTQNYEIEIISDFLAIISK